MIIFNMLREIPDDSRTDRTDDPHLHSVGVQALLPHREEATGHVCQGIGDVPADRGLALVVQHDLGDVPAGHACQLLQTAFIHAARTRLAVMPW
jgi:hypothetical protein